MGGVDGFCLLILVSWISSELTFTVAASLPAQPITNLRPLPDPQTNTAGYIGCLFAEDLCDLDTEHCFDDGAFGRCYEIYTSEKIRPITHELEVEELAALEDEMSSLLSEGYGWRDPKTQCVVAALLEAIYTKGQYSKIHCDDLRDDITDQDGSFINGFQEGGGNKKFNEIPDSDVAFIRYTPNDKSSPGQLGEFADELYDPPQFSSHKFDDDEDEEDDDEKIALMKKSNLIQAPNLFRRLYNTPDGFRTGYESKDNLEDAIIDDSDVLALKELLHSKPPTVFFDQDNNMDTDEPAGDIQPYQNIWPIDEPQSLYLLIRRSTPDQTPEFSLPERPDMELQLEDLELPNDSDNLFHVAETTPKKYPPKNLADYYRLQPNDDEDNLLHVKDIFNGDKRSILQSSFPEGGNVYNSDDADEDVEGLSQLLHQLDEWSFRRSERLDVKKPGPHFSTNNYINRGTSTEKPQEKSAVNNIHPEGQKETVPIDMPNRPVIKETASSSKKAAGRGEPAFLARQQDQSDDHYDIVDTTYAYIEFKEGIRTWKEGIQILKTVAEILQAPNTMFTNERVDQHEVTFKVVEPNPLNMNASLVARAIDDMKEQLRRKIGVIVTSVGVGDKTKLPSVVKLSGRDDYEVYVVLVIVVGALAALALSGGVLYLTRTGGSKLANLTQPDTEPSKHYQDLCRARMSSKNEVAPAQRVTSLSRESDNGSPSSRSSTSSWSEEPALSSMDISTGQMVLGNMEEHLKNKERLDNEWTALCSYQPDPSSTDEANQEENQVKNRYAHALPFDHARVLLNHLSNITGSAYINASTISDHDPRNPAYIVTQGPLPATAPDFWQMVWEQGCVVIVMLTRLVENDKPMCHRYWPEEGSELYHIFEVHLVSEHIWCDDYLVRSFYLKNMKTGETRTVTQFHFLSWPESGVPHQTKPLLEFRRKVNKSFRGRSCPIIVHCNDGLGRSGTYCLLDMVLNRMAKGAKEIDIAATLEHIRDQRQGCVATKQQFEFVISSVADEIQAILRVIPNNQ